MSSTRKGPTVRTQLPRSVKFPLGVLLALALTGCALKQPPPPYPVSHAPLVVDEAMQLRQWPMSVAHFANGSTVGLSTAFLLTHRAHEPIWAEALTDTPMFLINSAAWPVVLACSPPWQTIVYPDGGTEPSYNAMPPLPPR